MSKYILVCSVLALSFLAFPVLAINNQPISKPTVSPAEIFECEGPPTLDGSKSYDLDGSIARYDWYLGKDLYAQGRSAKVGSDIANHAGSYTFTLKVTDNGGASDSADATFVVLDNPMPHIDGLEYTAMSGNEIKNRNFLIAGDVFQLEAVRGKFNHGETYVWKYDQGIFQKIANGNKVSFRVISDSIQSNPKIEVSAFNACGIESNNVEIEIAMRSSNQNSPPTPSIELPPEIYEGKTFSASSSGSQSGQGHNDEGDSIVDWRWEIKTWDGKVILRSTAQNPLFTIENSGIFVAHLWETDSFGAIGYTNLSFSVMEAENDPSVADASATSKTAIFGQNFTLNASKSRDPDGRPEDSISRYEWYDMTYDPVNGKKLCGSSRPVCIAVFNRTGIHNIRLKVFDAGALGTEVIADIKINVISSPQVLPLAGNKAAVEEPQKALPSSGAQETPIDPRELLGKTPGQKAEEFPTSTKQSPGMESTIAAVSMIILAIAKRMKK